MRNLKILFILVGLISVAFLGTASAGQFGAPEPSARPGNISLGVGYFYNSDKCELSSNSQDYTFSQNQIYLQLGVASEKIEFYIRGGVADWNFENAFITSSPVADVNFAGFNGDLEDNYNLFGTMGVKGIFDINNNVGIGVFAQGSLFSDYNDTTSGLVNGISTTQELEINNYNEVDVGVTLQGKFDKFLVYAGPFVYWTHADMEATIAGAELSSSGSGNLNQSDHFGGVAGIRIPIAQKINIEIEGQIRQEISFGGAISYSF